VVGQAGKLLVRGVDQAGQLSVRWQDDDGATQSCAFPYQLKPKSKGQHAKTYEEVEATCVRAESATHVAGSGA
jgi:outer membrane usher protein